MKRNSQSSDNGQAFHMKKFNKNKGKSRDSKEKLKSIKCFNCNKLGYYSTKCSLPKKKQTRKVLMWLIRRRTIFLMYS